MAGVISVSFAGFRMIRSKHGSRLINNLFLNIFLGVKDIVIEIKHFIIPRKIKSAQPKPRTKELTAGDCFNL